MRPVSEATARVSSKNFRRKFIALGRIAAQWPEIMGESMADKAFPARIYYRKPKKKGDKPQTTLYIAAADAHATTMHYQTDLILERINHIFGEQWIQKIKFVPAADIKTLQDTPRPAARKLCAKDMCALDKTVGEIEDVDMRAYLRRLGESIFAATD
jgi:hypothetical protein